ncbi:hypothetical protein ACO1PK_04675 [Alishewanella sp. d11]|uniref:hypothetical protein n=1 Tax=Alishewanella sp. d11 TaxID=3414030 RepID=UPI003BF8784F
MQELNWEQVAEVNGGTATCTTSGGVTTCTCPAGEKPKSLDTGGATIIQCVKE